MSSKRRSYDTDEITLRRIFARSVTDNASIGAMKVLTADGTGGTYWGIPSTLGLNPSFNQINTTAGNFTADLSYNVFSMTAQSGIGFTRTSGSNELNIFSKGFNQFGISGNNTLYGFTNNVVTPTVKFAGAGGILVYSNPQTNTITIDTQGTQVSTSLYFFQKAQVFSNASTVTDSLPSTNSIILNAASPSSVLGFVGVGDLQLDTNAASNAIYFTLKLSTGTISTLTGSYNYLSTVTAIGLSSLSTLIQTTFNLSTTNLSTTNVFASTLTFNDINTAAKQVLAVSSGILVLNGAGITGTGDVTAANLISTVAGLGSAGYVSTFSTNTLSTGRLRAGMSEISTVNFKDTANANLYALASSNAALYFNGSLVGSGTVINNSNFSTYIYQVSSVSTLFAYADTISISTVSNAFLSPNFFSTVFFSTGNLTTSSVSFKDTVTNAVQYLAVKSGNLELNGVQVTTQPNLVSTVVGLGPANYISTPQLVSSIIGLGTAGFVSTASLYSTVGGLGAAGYVSTASLNSTVGGLGAAGYVSTASLYSTVRGLGSIGYLSTASLYSTVGGLGAVGYLSTSQLVSSIIGLGSAGYISSSQLTSTTAGILARGVGLTVANLASTVTGLGTSGYVSTATLYSTVGGLGASGYLSTASLYSTVEGLGSIGYLSSLQLTSTVAGLSKVAVTKIIAGSNVTISPTSGLGDVTINAAAGGGGGTSFTSFSTVLISTLAVTQVISTSFLSYINLSTFAFMGGVVVSSPSQFSQMSSVSFKIDRFSSFITSSANLYVGIQYDYLFSQWVGPAYIDQSPVVDVSRFFNSAVGFSTTLLLGDTPGNYIFDTYTPNLFSNTSLSYANHAGNQSYSLLNSNAYTRNQMFSIPRINFKNLYDSTFTLFHVLTYGRQAPGSDVFAPVQGTGSNPSGYSGFSSPNVAVNIGSNNAITLYVEN